jgi:ribose/xylose/arabinose/galactoside ABC-type transport system permease subunit
MTANHFDLSVGFLLGISGAVLGIPLPAIYVLVLSVSLWIVFEYLPVGRHRQEYLLPAFTAAVLGATSVRPGRVNVWGTILAVAVLAVTVAGLNQMGAPFFVEPIFNGAMLILAVGLAVTASKRSTKPGRTQ